MSKSTRSKDSGAIEWRILPEKERPAQFIGGVEIGKKAIFLYEYRTKNKAGKITGVEFPSFMCYDSDETHNHSTVGTPMSMRDFNELLSLFLTDHERDAIIDGVFPKVVWKNQKEE